MKTRFTGIKNLSSFTWVMAGALILCCASGAARTDHAENAPTPVKSDQARPESMAGAITDVTTTSGEDGLAVSIRTDRPTAPQEFLLENPHRLVLDFPDTRNRASFLRKSIDTAEVRQIRVQQFQTSPALIARVVLDLNKGYVGHEIVKNADSVKVILRRKGQATRTEEKTTEPPPVSAPMSAPKANQTETPVQIAAVPHSDSGPSKIAYTPSTRFTGQPLTLDLVDVPLVDFFRLMAEEGGINIVLDPDVKGKYTIKGEKMPWDQIFEMALVTNNLDKQVEGSVIRITRKATLQDEAKQREAMKKATLLAADLETRIKRLNYAKANSLLTALTDQKTVRGAVVVDERTNSLVLTDIPSSLDRMFMLINTLDIPQPQVEIEARIVSATRDFARDIGVQFGFVDGNLKRVTVGGPNTFGTIGGSRPSATPESTYVAGNPATGRGAASGEAGESGGVSPGGKGNYNVNLPATKAFGGVGISIGNIFDTFLLDAAITAGESKGMAKLISQPKVVAQNNSPAVVTQGLRFPVQVAANNTITVQFYNAALTLTVTPQITYEGNIVLDLKVENNTADFGKAVNAIPSIRTSESTTRVMVTDGGTTVIGGILMDSESNAEDKIPGLGSLPVVGNLFRRTSVMRATEEVLFFVTPRIVK